MDGAAARAEAGRSGAHLREWSVAAVPPLLFGLRLWASVSIALHISFWLELDNPYWAGTSAAIVCQPHLGASLRKGWFRMIGTVIGAVAIVVLTALFPQERGAFFLGLALWGAGCALVATLVSNFASYAAALAGYTVAIIAYDQLGATGGLNGQAFMLAVTRATEICIGIVSAGVVLGVTDFGDAPRRLAALLSSLASDVTRQCLDAFSRTGPESDAVRDVRRELIRRVVATGPVIDEAIGESASLRDHSPVLQAATNGLLAALAGWRTVALHLEVQSDAAVGQESQRVLLMIPDALRAAARGGETTRWTASPARLSDQCETAATALAAMPADTLSLRLIADETARGLVGLAQAFQGLSLLTDDREPGRTTRAGVAPIVTDWLPPLVAAGRAFVTILAAAGFWIATAWPNGALAITWAAIPVILFAPRADLAYGATARFMAGNAIATVFAAIIAFALLPPLDTFAGLSLMLALYLVPAGALAAHFGNTPMFAAMATNFVPVLAPLNQMQYDTLSFYNTALAILVGNGIAAVAFVVIPPPSPGLRARRQLALALRDLRRLATGPLPRKKGSWERRICARIAAMPDEATALDRARLLTAFSTGIAILELRRAALPVGIGAEVAAALDAFARRDAALSAERLGRVVAARRLDAPLALRTRACILVVREAFAHHISYFTSGGGP